jgi:hypothetical protein
MERSLLDDSVPVVAGPQIPDTPKLNEVVIPLRSRCRV